MAVRPEFVPEATGARFEPRLFVFLTFQNKQGGKSFLPNPFQFTTCTTAARCTDYAESRPPTLDRRLASSCGACLLVTGLSNPIHIPS
jgi:hypothetical protein